MNYASEGIPTVNIEHWGSSCLINPSIINFEVSWDECSLYSCPGAGGTVSKIMSILLDFDGCCNCSNIKG